MPRQRYRLLVALAGALLAAGLLVTACGEEEEEVQGTPAATATTPAAAEVPGVTDTEIVLGTHFPLSQHLAAAYAPIATAGMKGYFDYINDTEGGVNGRKIRFIICDSQYSPPVAAECARKLVEQDKVFAIVGGLGTPAHSAVWKYLEENGVPDMFILTGATKWTEPVVKTRFGGNPDYETEGKILGQYIAENYDGQKLGIVAQNDDFGEDGIKGLTAGIEGSDVEVISTERFEATAADLTAQVQRVKNAGAEVMAVYAVPPQAA